MSEPLRFDWEWLAYPELPAEEAATFAALIIRCNGKPATRLFDVQAQTIRDGLFAAAYPLALFLAENWWRLLWEPAPEQTPAQPQWRLAHSIAAAGSGYIWPNITLYGDGERVFAQVGPHQSTSSSVKFVSEFLHSFSIPEFEAAVDPFLAGVLARLEARGQPDTELKQIWQAVQMERRDVAQAEWRRLEAMAGYDPGAAPDAFLLNLMRLEQRLGTAAVHELVSASRARALSDVQALEAVIQSRGTPYRVPDKRGLVSEDPGAVPASSQGVPHQPWRRATETARALRRTWGLAGQPVDDATLARFLDMDPDRLESCSNIAVPYSAALLQDVEGRLVVRSGHRHGRRFALGRLLGDAFFSAEPVVLTMATDARTSRQQFQRAFSQEFLCPFDALCDFLGIPVGGDGVMDEDRVPNEDRIEDAAEYFQVSPVLVQRTLINNHILSHHDF